MCLELTTPASGPPLHYSPMREDVDADNDADADDVVALFCRSHRRFDGSRDIEQR